MIAHTGSHATPATPITLADAGLRERDDLQEWVLAHPEILGPDVMIVTFEGHVADSACRLSIAELEGLL